MSKLLYKLGNWVYKRPKRVIVAWLIIVIALAVATLNVGMKFSDSFSIPGSKSEKAGKMLEKATSSNKKQDTSTIRLILKLIMERI